MKKTFVLFTAMTVTFFMNGNLHSSNGNANYTNNSKFYCAWDPAEENCAKRTYGYVCGPVDENCNPVVIIGPGDPTR